VYGSQSLAVLSLYGDCASTGYRPSFWIGSYRKNENAITVVCDNFRGGYLVTEHLIQLEHRRIAFIDSHITISPVSERQRGYRSALRDHGFPIDEDLIVTSAGFRIEDGRNITLELLSLEAPPTAVFCYCDMMAFGVMRAAYEADLKRSEGIIGGRLR